MTPEWIAEETRLWNAMFAKPETSGTKKNVQAAARAKRAGRKFPDLPTESQVVTRSWAAYQKWLAHQPPGAGFESRHPC